MSVPSEQLLNNPQYKLFKKMILDSVRAGEGAIKIAQLENELCTMMLESSIKILKSIIPLCLFLPPEISTQVIEDGLQLIKDNKPAIADYDQALKNIKLIIDSDGIKN